MWQRHSGPGVSHTLAARSITTVGLARKLSDGLHATHRLRTCSLNVRVAVNICVERLEIRIFKELVQRKLALREQNIQVNVV